MRRLMATLCLALAGGSCLGLAAHPALAASLCVGSSPVCFSTIQAALNAAHNGDVIHIDPGTFAGGLTIANSVKIIGAGAGSTVIQGGGPVVTILPFPGVSQPRVSIVGVTITGGSNTSSPTPFKPLGGGVSVLPSTSGSKCNANLECIGATVTITDSVITHNTATATSSASCGAGCSFTLPLGGGISNFGAMTLNNTTVSNNVATDNVNPRPTFDLAIGGGIETTDIATLTLHDSMVTGNSARATSDSLCVRGFGGGINSDGLVTMDGSTLSSNSIMLTGTVTDPSCEVQGIGGGMRLTESASATIRGSVVTGNSVSTTGYTGFVNSAAGAIDDDGFVLLQDSTVSKNQVTSTVTSTQPIASALSDAGAMEIDGTATIKNTKIIGNSATATSPAGVVNGSPSAVGGALVVTTVHPVIVMDSVISGNSVSAATTSGSAFALGGGIFNCSTTLRLSTTTVTNNSGTATGPPGGAAQGGGIWNSDCGMGAPALTLIDSAVTHNTLTASSGIAVQGGGVFNTGALTLTNSVIAQNSPDQCFGC